MIVLMMVFWCFALAVSMFVAGWCSASIALSHKADSWRDRAEELEIKLYELYERGVE